MKSIGLLLTLAVFVVSGCSSARSLLALDSKDGKAKPIRNPFETVGVGRGGGFGSNLGAEGPSDNLVLRTKRGDGAVEVEIPKGSEGMSDFIIPVNGSSVAGSGTPARGRGPASVGDGGAPSPADSSGIDNSYLERKPSMADRELTRAIPRGLPEDDAQRRDIEQSLGLVSAADDAPERAKSYLAAIDHIKQLYRAGRFEAGLIETDSMIADYPTDPKIFAMRGTLFDRLGQRELAMKAWKQALRFEPGNVGLRRFIERREMSAMAAGGGGGRSAASVANVPVSSAPADTAPAVVVPAPGAVAPTPAKPLAAPGGLSADVPVTTPATTTTTTETGSTAKP